MIRAEYAPSITRRLTRSSRKQREAALNASPHGDGLAAPRFSMVIPCYNEGDDVAATIAAVEAQQFTPHEIIVVDGGSTDRSLPVLRMLDAAGRIVLIEEGRRRGVSAARNTGIEASRGDVVVLLNADVVPAPDFLESLTRHYRRGFGAVSVQSRVENLGDATGRYLQAEHALTYAHESSVGWTEGFSVRRDQSARFPEEIPGAGGEDVVFFDRLLAAGTTWTCDFSIVVPHRVPGTFVGFWHQWRSRGNALPYAEARVEGLHVRTMTMRRMLATCWSAALALAMVPACVASVRRARRSHRGLRDAPMFWLLLHTQRAAHRIGEWQSVMAIWRQGRV